MNVRATRSGHVPPPLLKLLVLALVAASLPLSFYRTPAEPGSPFTAEGTDEQVVVTLDEGVPETVILREIAKGQLAGDVIAGRRTLWEAAALFRALNGMTPALSNSPRVVDPSLNIPADTEEAWLCRQVVAFVGVELHEQPDRAEAAVARLEAEFFAALRTHGTIRLPDASALPSGQELLERARPRATP
jgi:hypothetical protein